MGPGSDTAERGRESHHDVPIQLGLRQDRLARSDPAKSRLEHYPRARLHRDRRGRGGDTHRGRFNGTRGVKVEREWEVRTLVTGQTSLARLDNLVVRSLCSLRVR